MCVRDGVCGVRMWSCKDLKHHCRIGNVPCQWADVGVVKPVPTIDSGRITWHPSLRRLDTVDTTQASGDAYRASAVAPPVPYTPPTPPPHYPIHRSGAPPRLGAPRSWLVCAPAAFTSGGGLAGCVVGGVIGV